MYKQYGSDHGKLIFYFHGIPGSLEEFAGIFNQIGILHQLKFVCLDRVSIPVEDNEKYFQTIAEEMIAVAQGKPFHIIGFSLGTFIAMQVCRNLKNSKKDSPIVGQVHLVSAVAPLDGILGTQYLPYMAGRIVFRLARDYPIMFTGFVYFQRILTYFCPQVLFQLICSDVRGNDVEIVKKSEFRLELIGSLKYCLLNNLHGYMRDIRAYVFPWLHTVSDLNSLRNMKKMYLWHGQLDNWTPLSMAHHLHSILLPWNKPILSVFEDASHFSCLFEALPQIGKLISEDQ